MAEAGALTRKLSIIIMMLETDDQRVGPGGGFYN